jgi:hypothetical protein
MSRFEPRVLAQQIARLLLACRDRILRFARFGPYREGTPEGDGYTGDPCGEFCWVFDPERKVWLMELSYSFRSLEYRLQAGEADPPPGIRVVRRILGKGP